MSDYEDVLKKSWEEIPEPKLLPVGSWLLRGRNAAFLEPKEEGQNARVLFFYIPKSPMDDVDEGALAALGDDYDYAENDVIHTIWIERNKDWDRVRKHLALHGIEATGPIQDTLKKFKNSEVFAYLDQRAFETKAGEKREENVPTNFASVTAA